MDRKLIAVAVSTALGMSATAQAVEFSASGHINRAIVSVDNGADMDGDLQHVDADSSESRFRFTGSEELETGMTVGVNMEFGAFVDKGGKSDADDPDGKQDHKGDLRVRHSSVNLGGEFGKLTVGQASTPTDSTPYANFIGTAFLGGVTNWCSYASNGTAACTALGSGRKGLIRYDSPKIGPATIAASFAGNDFWDASISISGAAGETEYDLRVGYVGKTDTSETTEAVEAGKPTMTERVIDGGELLGVLQDENAYDADAETDAPGSFLYDNEGARLTTLPNDQSGLSDLIEAHLKANPGVELMRVGTDDDANIEDNVYRKTTTTPGADAVPAMTTVTESGDTVHVSGAVKFAMGTSVNVAWAKEETGMERQYLFAALAHDYGSGSVGAYIKRGSQNNAAGMEVDSSVLGVGLGHIVGSGLEVYSGYRVMKDDTPGKEDVKLIVAGLRVSFN
jgi:predicted porin